MFDFMVSFLTQYLTIEDLLALWLSVKLALVSTLILLVCCLPISWWLSQTQSRWKSFVQSLLTLPLILPPTVLGFYLLIFFSPSGFLGQFFIDLTGQSLVFSFSGLILGSVIYSLPFVFQPLYVAFNSVSRQQLELSQLLGAKSWDTFLTVVLPLSKSGIYTAVALAMAHTMGEFGVVLMIGGNIPNETRVISIAIYDNVETLQYAKAHGLSVLLLIFSFMILLAVFYLNKRHVNPKT